MKVIFITEIPTSVLLKKALDRCLRREQDGRQRLAEKKIPTPHFDPNHT